MNMIARLMSFLSGGQSDFLIPLSHQWHGINVAPLLDFIAFGGFLAALSLLPYCAWRAVQRRPSIVAVVLLVVSATAAYAASSTLGNLSAGSALSATDLFYDVQTVGTGGVKVTGTQLLAFLGTTVNTGPGATGGSCTPGTTCTIATQEATTHTLTSSGAIQTTDAGGRIVLNDASSATLTLENLTTGQFTNVYNENTGTWTLSPNSGSISAGCTTVPQNWWAHIGFDGTNYYVGCGPNAASGSSGANPSALAGPSAINGSATTFMRSDAAPAITAPHPGYVGAASLYYLPANYASSGISNGNPRVSGQMYCQYAMFPTQVTIEAVAIRLETNAVLSHTAIGLYTNVSGRPSTLITNTGSISTTVTDFTNISTALGSNEQVGPGTTNGRDIWICQIDDTSGLTFSAYSSGGAAGAVFIGSSSMDDVLDGGNQVTGLSAGGFTLGTWPSLAGTSWTPETGGHTSVIGVEVATSP